jgi:hypothetical protein
MYRKYINIVEAANKGCPIATHDIDVNLKNRQKAIDEYHYGPANPDEPGDYWKDNAKQWDIAEKTAKTMLCGNCAAFDVSDKIQDCIARGIGSEPGSDPTSTIDAGDLGYCKFLKFKCASKRTCDAWVEGGPIT